MVLQTIASHILSLCSSSSRTTSTGVVAIPSLERALIATLVAICGLALFTRSPQCLAQFSQNESTLGNGPLPPTVITDPSRSVNSDPAGAAMSPTSNRWQSNGLRPEQPYASSTPSTSMLPQSRELSSPGDYQVENDFQIDRGYREDSVSSPTSPLSNPVTPSWMLTGREANPGSQSTDGLGRSALALQQEYQRRANQQNNASPDPGLAAPGRTSIGGGSIPGSQPMTGNSSDILGPRTNSAMGNQQGYNSGQSSLAFGAQGDMAVSDGRLINDQPTRSAIEYGNLADKQALVNGMSADVSSDPVVDQTHWAFVEDNREPQTVKRPSNDLDSRDLGNLEANPTNNNVENNPNSQNNSSLAGQTRIDTFWTFLLFLSGAINLVLGWFLYETRKNYYYLADELQDRFFRDTAV